MGTIGNSGGSPGIIVPFDMIHRIFLGSLQSIFLLTLVNSQLLVPDAYEIYPENAASVEEGSFWDPNPVTSDGETEMERDIWDGHDDQLIPKIMGGTSTEEREFPSIVKMLNVGCSATIISPEWVIGAAHCLLGRTNPSQYKFAAGIRNFRDIHLGRAQIVTAVKVFVHERYRRVPLQNDICLFKVTPPFRFNDKVQPAALPSSSWNNLGAATAAGWGADCYGQHCQGANDLQKVTLSLVSNPKCSRLLGRIIDPTNLCAGHSLGGKDTCLGDSGGPLYVPRGSGKQMLIGIISSGYGCGMPNTPGIYTRVSSYLPWIQAKVYNNPANNVIFNPFTPLSFSTLNHNNFAMEPSPQPWDFINSLFQNLNLHFQNAFPW